MKILTRILFVGAVVYLAADFFAFNGPARRLLNPSPTDLLAARVSGQNIGRSHLDRAIHEHLWLQGKAFDSATSRDREVVLDELIADELLRQRLKAASPQPAVKEEEINSRLQLLSDRFESGAALDTAMKSQGIADKSALRDRLAARIRLEKFVEQLIASEIKITDAEALKWFEENQAAVALPERIEARHVFLPTLDHPPEEAKEKLETALVELIEKKKDFSTLAKELSEDPATKQIGGNLGWMTRDRLPADFAAPVFLLEINKPTLVRTKLGWHLVEITARKPAETRCFDQAKTEIFSALESIKRRTAIAALRKSLRMENSGNIEIFK